MYLNNASRKTPLVQKERGIERYKKKVSKTINHLAELTGTLLGYDKTSFSKERTDPDVMKSMDLRRYLRDTKIGIDKWRAELDGMNMTPRMVGLGFISSMSEWYSMGKYRTVHDFLIEYGHTMYMSLRIINVAKQLFVELDKDPHFQVSILNGIALDKEIYKKVKIAFVYIVCIKRAEYDTLEQYWKNMAAFSASILASVRKFRENYVLIRPSSQKSKQNWKVL